MNHGHNLLALIIVALDRIVVHGHDEEAALLAHLQDVRIVDGIGKERLVRQAVDEQLVIQCDK